MSKNFSSSLFTCLIFSIMISENSAAPYLYTPEGSSLDYFNLRCHTPILHVNGNNIFWFMLCGPVHSSSIPHTNAASSDSLDFCSNGWCWMLSIISSITYHVHDVSEIVSTPVFTWLVLLHTALIRCRSIAMRKFETCLLISSTTSGTKRNFVMSPKAFWF
jgi:hypothetical protein